MNKELDDLKVEIASMKDGAVAQDDTIRELDLEIKTWHFAAKMLLATCAVVLVGMVLKKL